MAPSSEQIGVVLPKLLVWLRRTSEHQTVQESLYFSAFIEIKESGPDRDRTDDLLNAIQALSQLSYGPLCFENVNG